MVALCAASSTDRKVFQLSNVLVTGGAGFIGSNFVRMLLESSDHTVVNVDALTYAGNLENLQEVEKHERYTFVRADIVEPEAPQIFFGLGHKYLA